MNDIQPFIDFTTNLFPSISPYVAEKTKKSLEQFKLDGKVLNNFTNKPLEYIAQGDIFKDITFPYINENGDIGTYKTDAMVLTNLINTFKMSTSKTLI